MKTDKSKLFFSLEHYYRPGVSLKDRWYSKARAKDDNGDGVIDLYDETYGLSYYSRNLKDPKTGEMFAAPTCPGSIETPVNGFWGG